MPDDPKRNAEGTVSAAGTQATTGPGSKQEADPFSFDDLRFPPGIGTNDDVPKMLHWIKFVPCIQEKSAYQVKEYDGFSQADLNRGGGRGAGAFDAFSGAAAGAGLAALSTAENAVNAAKSLYTAEIPSNINPKNKKAVAAAAAREVSKVGKKFVADEISAGVNAGLATAVVESIKLTRKTKRAKAFISLYMPDTINQTLVNQYDEVSMTAALGKAGLAGAAGQSLASTAGNMTGLRAGLGGGGVADDVGGLAEAAGALAEASGNFGAGIGDALLFSAGLAQNPQVELLFKTIKNRDFQFDFKFIPKNPAEAQEIRKIVQAFRFFGAPELPTAGTGRYFIPPSEFDITFMLGQAPNPNLPKLSTCVLEGVDVNYGSAGQWTAFQDGMPVEISMVLKFKEVEIIHKKLIKDGY